MAVSGQTVNAAMPQTRAATAFPFVLRDGG